MSSIAAVLPISIHALLAESDCGRFVHQLFAIGISIHALLAESDRMILRWLAKL